MGQADVQLRRFPYPYKAMLAVCSDLDETPDRRVYWEIARFLNTTETTSMGPGVGLEVGNSIYFDMPPDQFAYWNTDDAGREMVRAMIRSGHIDCLHSYGDLAMRREHAGRALDELSRHDCRLDVWVDHGTAVTNFGADIMVGQGDVPGSVAYHADLTCDYGIKYVWLGRVTSVIGQEVERSLGGLFNLRHPVQSARTIGKELTKGMMARRGDAKYAMHGPNKVMRPVELRDGRPVFEFIRCNPHWGGVSCGDTGQRLAEVLTPAFLDRLIGREGVCNLYTHLGKITNRKQPFGHATVAALGMLADYVRRRTILVTTTRRLLGFCRAQREVSVQTSEDESGAYVEIDASSMGVSEFGDIGRSDLAGLTWYVADPERVRVAINGCEVNNVRRNGPDHTGQSSISLPWTPLEFPEA